MSIKKKNQYLGLDKLNVYKEDILPTSQYFKVSNIPDTLSIGKSSFIIRGSKFLKSASELKVEVIDSKGGVIYSEFVNDIEQSNGRPVTIEVYDDTPVGLATIYIVGEIQGVPKKWRGIYNARWSHKLFVDPTHFNKQPINFIKKPTLLVEEKNIFYREFHPETSIPLQISSSLYQSGSTINDNGSNVEFVILSNETGLNMAIDKFPDEVKNQKKKFQKDFLTSKYLDEGYAIGYLRGLTDIQTGSFESQMIGHTFTAKKTIGTSGSYENYDEGYGGLKEDYTGSIVNVYNDKLLLMKPGLKDNKLITGSLVNSTLDVNGELQNEYSINYRDKAAKIPNNRDWQIDYKSAPSESLMSGSIIDGAFSRDKSFAQVQIKDLDTYSGEVSRLQVFTSRHRSEFAEPEMIYDGVVPNRNILRNYNEPPRNQSNIGSFKTGSEHIIGSGSLFEHWFQDKISLSGSAPVNSASEGSQDNYGKYSEWTASTSNDTFVDSVKLQGSVSDGSNLLRFHTSGSYYFTPGKWVFEAKIKGENPNNVPSTFPGTNLFVYISGSGFKPRPFKKDDDYISGIEVPLKDHWGQPIASYNPQFRNGKIRSSLIHKKRNFKRVKAYFDVEKGGQGILNFYVYNPNYNTSQSLWTLSDIQLRQRRDVGYHPGSVNMFVPIRTELQEDILDFEVRYLNMDNDTAVDVSRYDNVNFTGSNYEMMMGGLLDGRSGIKKKNESNNAGLFGSAGTSDNTFSDFTPLGQIMANMYGLELTSSMVDGVLTRYPIFTQGLRVGRTAKQYLADSASFAEEQELNPTRQELGEDTNPAIMKYNVFEGSSLDVDIFNATLHVTESITIGEEITVSGAVNNPSKSIYRKGMNARKYVRLSGGRLSTTSGKPFVIYPSGKAKKIGFLRNPKVFPGSEIFIPFEEKTPFLDRLGQGINQSLDRIVQMSTLATATITTIYLVRNINN